MTYTRHVAVTLLGTDKQTDRGREYNYLQYSRHDAVYCLVLTTDRVREYNNIHLYVSVTLLGTDRQTNNHIYRQKLLTVAMLLSDCLVK